tara:strand:+ start:493 stop:666 length:174 start_codon:yes stop_codon:yes gene_type:complete
MSNLKDIWEDSNLSDEDIKQICNGNAESQLRMRLYRDIDKQIIDEVIKQIINQNNDE